MARLISGRLARLEALQQKCEQGQGSGGGGWDLSALTTDELMTLRAAVESGDTAAAEALTEALLAAGRLVHR